MTLPVYWTYFHILLSNLPPVTQCILVFMQSPTGMVGSRTQMVAYCTGYHTTVVKACIRLPSWWCHLHLVISLFLFTLTTLHLEHHGVKFSKVPLPKDWFWDLGEGILLRGEYGDQTVILMGGCDRAHVPQCQHSCLLWEYELLPAMYGNSGRFIGITCNTN